MKTFFKVEEHGTRPQQIYINPCMVVSIKQESEYTAIALSNGSVCFDKRTATELVLAIEYNLKNN